MRKAAALFLAIVLALSGAPALGQFAPGQKLTAEQLNAALASPTITSGNINGTPIGQTNPSIATFTNLTVNGTFASTGTFNLSPTTLGTINNMSIGQTVPAAGTFTTLCWKGSGLGTHLVCLANSETLTADRTLTVTLGDSNRTLSLGGNLTTAGSFTTAGSASPLTLTISGTTGVTLPTSGTLSTLAGSEALTNKTVNGATITSTTGTLTLANSSTLATSGAFSTTFTATGTGNLTVPAATDTLVGRATTDTLTNKTITNPANTTQALTDGSTVNWDASSGAIATWTIGGNRTAAAPTNLKTGGRYVLIITQDATGGRTVSWNGVFKGQAGQAMPQPHPTLSGITVFTFTSPDGTNLDLDTSPGMTLIGTATASNSSSLDFFNLGGCNSVFFVYKNMVPVGANDQMAFRVSSDGSTFLNGSQYEYAYFVANSDSSSAASGAEAQPGWAIGGTQGNASLAGASGTLMFYPTGAARITYHHQYFNGTHFPVAEGGGMIGTSNTNMVGGRFYYTGGNISAGTVNAYCMR